MATKQTYTCPVCRKVVRDLPEHTKRMHPTAGPSATNTATADPQDKTPLTASTDFKIAPPKNPAPGPAKYHCIECGTSLTKGQTPCPGCGRGLDWPGVA